MTGSVNLIVPAEGAQSALALEFVVELHGPVKLILVCPDIIGKQEAWAVSRAYDMNG